MTVLKSASVLVNAQTPLVKHTCCRSVMPVWAEAACHPWSTMQKLTWRACSAEAPGSALDL